MAACHCVQGWNADWMQLTVAIGDEIRDSTSLADKMNDQFENSRLRIRGTMNRMLRMAEKTGVGWKVWLGFFAAICVLFWYVWLFWRGTTSGCVLHTRFTLQIFSLAWSLEWRDIQWTVIVCGDLQFWSDLRHTACTALGRTTIHQQWVFIRCPRTYRNSIVTVIYTLSGESTNWI